MKITYLGLSCFMIENIQGDRILIDPYNDTPQYSFGLRLPNDLQADIFLVSHPDEDHSYLNSKWTRKPHEDPSIKDIGEITALPRFNLKGTLVKEYGGDMNIAYSFYIDGFTFLHLADNARLLTEQQLKEIGGADVVFISPPKIPGLNYHIENIKFLYPKIVIPSHYIPPNTVNSNPTYDEVNKALEKIIMQDWITNPHANLNTVKIMTDMYFECRKMKNDFPDFREINTSFVELDPAAQFGSPTVLFFMDCLGLS